MMQEVVWTYTDAWMFEVVLASMYFARVVRICTWVLYSLFSDYEYDCYS